MKHLQAQPEQARRTDRAWPAAKSCLLAIPLCASLLASCKNEGAGASESGLNASGGSPAVLRLPYHYAPVPGAASHGESATVPAGAQAVPPQPAPAAPTAPEAFVAPAPQAPPTAPAVAPLADAAALLPALNAIISARVSQARAKMKLTPEEGRLAQEYVSAELPRSPALAALASGMPKTAIELCRAVHERGVAQADADGIAGYLVRLLGSMRLGRPDTFDECCSHVLGRKWSEIDYSGEGVDWRAQEKSYSSKGAPDLLTPGHVRAYFAVESRMPYFRKVFRPQGPLP
jgi:hypothetical protein